MQQSYFELFGLTPAFTLDLTQLEARFRAIQSASHPDRFVTSSTAEKLQAMQTATQANEAYLTLKTPANRAKYWLALQGIDAVAETNTAMPADFLMQQLEWREEVADAAAQKDVFVISKVLSTIKQMAKTLENQLLRQFEQNDWLAATASTRRLVFIEKVSSDIQTVLDQLEDELDL